MQLERLFDLGLIHIQLVVMLSLVPFAVFQSASVFDESKKVKNI